MKTLSDWVIEADLSAEPSWWPMVRDDGVDLEIVTLEDLRYWHGAVLPGDVDPETAITDFLKALGQASDDIMKVLSEWVEETNKKLSVLFNGVNVDVSSIAFTGLSEPNVIYMSRQQAVELGKNLHGLAIHSGWADEMNDWIEDDDYWDNFSHCPKHGDYKKNSICRPCARRS